MLLCSPKHCGWDGAGLSVEAGGQTGLGAAGPGFMFAGAGRKPHPALTKRGVPLP